MCPDPRRQRGFSLISAIFLIVVMASLVVFMVKLTSEQTLAGVADLEGARGLQAARAGTDYGLYQVLQSGSCSSTNLTFPDAGLSGWAATVACTSYGPYTDGSSLTIYSIVVTACNRPSSGACPGTANGSNYVERRLTTAIYK